jgi:NDP-sugar pyrophosphorylase family protein
MNIVIPMAGEGSRFVACGFEKPKPFIDVLGKPMIVHVIENLNYPDANFILIGRKSHIKKEVELIKEIKSKYNVTFIEIDKLTEGTACTILFGNKLINNNDSLLIANSDQIVDIDITDFITDCLSRNLDGSILTFKDEKLNPKWSFAKTDNNGLVTEVQEKKPISDTATVGIYFFSKGKYFVQSALEMIINNDRVNNEFYTCPVYNYMIKNKQKIGIYNIPIEKMHGIGTPEDLNAYINILKNG